MCSNPDFFDTVECYMDDLVECFEDYVKKSLLVISLCIASLIGLVMYMLKVNTGSQSGITDSTRRDQSANTFSNQFGPGLNNKLNKSSYYSEEQQAASWDVSPKVLEQSMNTESRAPYSSRNNESMMSDHTSKSFRQSIDSRASASYESINTEMQCQRTVPPPSCTMPPPSCTMPPPSCTVPPPSCNEGSLTSDQTLSCRKPLYCPNELKLKYRQCIPSALTPPCMPTILKKPCDPSPCEGSIISPCPSLLKSKRLLRPTCSRSSLSSLQVPLCEPSPCSSLPCRARSSLSACRLKRPPFGNKASCSKLLLEKQMSCCSKCCDNK